MALIDFGLKNRRSEETDVALLRNLQDALESYDALIFNQQVTGSITKFNVGLSGKITNPLKLDGAG